MVTGNYLASRQFKFLPFFPSPTSPDLALIFLKENSTGQSRLKFDSNNKLYPKLL